MTTAQPKSRSASPLASAVTHCLSVRQPWASLIVSGFKSVENRSWKTDYRGTIAIHASGTYRDMTQEVDFLLARMHPKIDAFINGEPDPSLLDPLEKKLRS